MIVQHALARSQRDEKLYLCHDVWNGSHPHLLVLTKDAEQCKRFYTEVQKKITDCLKRLFGLDYLCIWEGRPTVALIADVDEAINRISYLYANPAQDNLETSIERFPGISSWSDFLQIIEEPNLSVSVSQEVLRLRLPNFPKFQSFSPSFAQEQGGIRLLKRRNSETQFLIRHPNMWMRAFGIRETGVPGINRLIVKKLRRREELANWLRKLSGKSVLGSMKLKSQPILKPHKPKKKERKVFYFGSCNEARKQFLGEFEEFCLECANCFKEWLSGNFLVQWPPGAFKPPLPPNMNIIEFLY